MAVAADQICRSHLEAGWLTRRVACRFRPRVTAWGLAVIVGGLGPLATGAAEPGRTNVFGEGTATNTHWAYRPPIHYEPPAVSRPDWVRQPIDAFVLARLDGEGLSPAPEADRGTLIRRLSLDLTGLPPSVSEVAAFQRDRRPDAYERLVDRLLASPHYGERWARPWLDLARYADTNGYEADHRRSNWLYRDWVIDALNRDLPFDEFTIEQLAGDLLPGATIDQRIATGFHRNTMVNTEGGTDDEEFRVAAVIDRVNTTFGVWMGTTFGCCQCHDHKYDPFTQQEYYRVFAFFNQTKDTGRENKPELDVPTPAQASKRAELKAKIDPLQAVLDTSTPEVERAQAEWEKTAQANRQGIEGGWATLTADTAKASGAVTLEPQPDLSLLASGATPDTGVYDITARTDRETITALRLEMVPDDRLPQGGAGRSEIGNFVLTEFALEARPREERQPDTRQSPRLGPWFSLGPRLGTWDDPTLERELGPKQEIDVGRTYLGGKLRWLEQSELADGQVHALAGGRGVTYLYRVIIAEKPGPLMVSLGSRDGLGVWLNGRQLLAKNVSRATAPAQDTVRLDLEAGENHLLLKTGSEGQQSAYYFAIPQDQSAIYRVKLAQAYSDVAESGFGADLAIDADPKSGWSGGNLDVTNRMPHYAVFVPEKPIHFPGGARLTIGLHQESQKKQHLLGRFRLSVSTAPIEAHRGWGELPTATRALLEKEVGQRVAKDKESLAAYYRAIAPALARQRQELADLRKQEPKDVATTLVLEAVAKPRVTHVLKRGSFLNPGDEVNAGVPAILNPLPTNAPLDRLTFARWLMDPANPLVGRVTMNRIWALYFGRGLVETSEDFGRQGERPTHPELLDWLATEFVRRHWSLKAMHRLIVTSATYRQASAVAPELTERDPFNRLLARGPCFRMEAEMLRDNALAVGGLLDSKVGGPSVFPYQPEGVWSNPYSEDRWTESKAGDQFRRGLYTFWRRTAPYASFVAFDAPSREVCTERRPRTNTPLQALATLNDPAYVVAAEGLARQVLGQGGRTERQRLAYAFERCLARRPTAAETEVLLSLARAARQRFTSDPIKAKAMAAGILGLPKAKTDLPELAAWTVVGNVLLNLDECVTKN